MWSRTLVIIVITSSHTAQQNNLLEKGPTYIFLYTYFIFHWKKWFGSFRFIIDWNRSLGKFMQVLWINLCLHLKVCWDSLKLAAAKTEEILYQFKKDIFDSTFGCSMGHFNNTTFEFPLSLSLSRWISCDMFRIHFIFIEVVCVCEDCYSKNFIAPN